MSGWAHAEEIRSLDAAARYVMVCWADPYPERETDLICGCQNPTPDPTSLCGFEGCPLPDSPSWHEVADIFAARGFEPRVAHPHIPTRCLHCQHPIAAVP